MAPPLSDSHGKLAFSWPASAPRPDPRTQRGVIDEGKPADAGQDISDKFNLWLKRLRKGGAIACTLETGDRMTDISGVEPKFSAVASREAEGFRLDWVSCATWMGATLLSAGFWTLIVSAVA